VKIAVLREPADHASYDGGAAQPFCSPMTEIQMIDDIFALSDQIRYVAMYRDEQLQSRSREGTENASSSESDRYEELLVNPTLLKLASQRGNIDCGGLEYLVVRYGNFFQFVVPTAGGHVSVCIEKEADPIEIGLRVKMLVENEKVGA
jgi:hypothetical protein